MALLTGRVHLLTTSFNHKLISRFISLMFLEGERMSSHSRG